MSEQRYAGQIDEQQVKAFISQQPWQDRERLTLRHQRYGKLKDIPDKRWWLNLIDLTPVSVVSKYPMAVFGIKNDR